VIDAQELSQQTMQRIAREFNQSETTFPLSPTKPLAEWRLHCFTPAGVEVSGVGHHALRVWWWLAEAGRLRLAGPRTVFPQALGEGVLPVEVLAERGNEGRSWQPTAIRMVEGMPAQVVSTGAAHLLVPVRSREAIKRTQPDAKSLYTQLRSVDGQGCYLFSLDRVDPAAVAYTRCFNPSVGIVEDPATGRAAGPLACYLATEGHITSEAQVMIEQDYVQERPGHIEVRVFGAGVTVAEGVRSAALKRERRRAQR